MSYRDFTRFSRCGMVGIAPADFLRQRNDAVAKGEYDPPADDPYVWVNSQDELDAILKNPLHPRHNPLRRAAKKELEPDTRTVREERPRDIHSKKADRVHRLLIWLDEMTKPYDQRASFVKAV